MPLDPLAAVLLLVILVALPVHVLRTHRSGLILEIPREAIYVMNAITQWGLVGVLAVVVWLEGPGAPPLGLHTLPRPGALAGWTAAATLVALAVLLLTWPLRGAGRGLEHLRHVLPGTRREAVLFVLLVAPTAGVAEELLFRAFAMSRLALVLPWGAAVALALLAFAAGHAYQGPAGLVLTAVLGAVLTVPWLVTGSLWPSILAHTAIDIVAGLCMARALRRDVNPGRA